MQKEYTLDLHHVSLEKQDRLAVLPYCQPDMANHNHHFFELVYITGGTTMHTLNNTSNLLSAGDYFIIDYGSVHCYHKSDHLTLINCLFLPEVIDPALSDCHSFDVLAQSCLIKYYTPTLMPTPVNRIFHDEDGSILALLSGMQKEYQDKQIGYTEIFRCRLIEILLLTLRRMLHAHIQRPQNTTILEVIQYVDSNYQSPVSLKQFCEQYHFSLPYISRKFKQETGLTFKDYLQKVRIEKSCTLLVGSDLPILEIAHLVGYNDIKFFNTIFKKMLNMPPREYRRLSLSHQI